jgi:4-amino-4-deoxy-L-arabinose transferase-like glycosyltransferase
MIGGRRRAGKRAGRSPPAEEAGPAFSRGRAPCRRVTHPLLSQTPVPPSPAPPLEKPAGPRAAFVWFFLLAFGVLFAWNSWDRDFWEPDEPRIALLAKTMEERGEWLLPTLEGQPYVESPPLAVWLPAVSHRLTGLDPRFSYRLPFVLVAVLGLWLTYAAGRGLFDGRIGFLAAAIQASTLLYYRKGAWLDDDLIFAVAVEAALIGFALGSRKGGRRLHVLAGWTGLAVAGLTKSILLGSVLVFVPFTLFLFFEGGLGSVQRGYGRALSKGSFLWFLLLIVPWYAATAWTQGGAFLEGHFLRQHLERLWRSAWDAEPPHYYIFSVLISFLPWTIFLPLGLLHGKDRTSRDGERLALIWALCPLIILSFVSAKKPGYMLVIWPPLALLISASFFETRDWYSMWEDFLREGVFRAVPYILKVPLFLVLLAAAAYFGGYWKGSTDERVQALLTDRDRVLRILILLGLGATATFALAGRVRRLVAEGALPKAAFDFACAALIIFTAASFAYDDLNSFGSWRPVLERFTAKIPEGAPVALYGRAEPAVLYYIGRPVERLSYPDPRTANDPALLQIEAYLGREGEVFILGKEVEIEQLKRLFSSLTPRLNKKDEGRVGISNRLLLLSNKG